MNIRKIIPCLCILWLAVVPGGSQSYLPAAYSYNGARIASINSAAAASSQEKIRLYLSPTADSEAAAALAQEEIRNSAQRLTRQKAGRKPPRKMLQLLRQEVEGKYLRRYRQLADFSGLFARQEYNDITAAVLVSLLLQELEIGHQLYWLRQQPRIELADGTALDLEHWGRNRPAARSGEEEQSRLIALLNALQLPPEHALHQNALAPYRTTADKRLLLPAELTGLLFYRRALDFYANRQQPAALTALEKARTYINDPRLDLVQYAVFYQQAAAVGPDSPAVAPLFALYRLHASPMITLELMRRFAAMAEYYLLKKNDPYGFEALYADYRLLFAGKSRLLQQLKEIYFIEMAQYYAGKFDPPRVVAFLDSLTAYRPDDPQIQKILTPLLMRSLTHYKDPEAGLSLLDTYRRDYPFLHRDPLFKDMELRYRAERTRLAFDAEQENQGRQYLEAFEQHMAQAGLTPRSPLWITTAYYSASSYYFRRADYPNARWYVERALALIPGDAFLLHRQEVLRNY